MTRIKKLNSFWTGLIVFVYSIFLFFQGVWVYTSYPTIYPQMYWYPSGFVPNNDWVFQMMGAIVPSLVGGFIFMLVGLYMIDSGEKSKTTIGLSALGYSSVLFLQTIWLLFFLPNFYPQLTWYISNGIFINYPIFFRIIGVILPPLAGGMIYGATGMIITTKKS